MVAERLQDIGLDRAQPRSTHPTAFCALCHIACRAERERRQVIHMGDDEVAQLRCRQRMILLQHVDVTLEEAQRFGVLWDRPHEAAL